MVIKKNNRTLFFTCLVFPFIINIGCNTYKTEPLAWDGAPVCQHTIRITQNKTEFILKDWGIDTVYSGIIKSKNGLNVKTHYEYKTRISTTEKSRFYLIEFTDINTKQIDGIWYDINENEILLVSGPAIPLPANYSGKGFTKELLAQLFFVWKNKEN